MKFVDFIKEDAKKDQPPSQRVEEQCSRIIDMMMQFQIIRDNFTINDVKNGFSMLATHLGKNLRNITKDDLNVYLNEMFEKRFVYNFFFSISIISGFPDEFKIGYGIIKSFKKLPKEVKDYIASTWELAFKENSTIYGIHCKTFEEYKEGRENEAYLCLEITSFGLDKAILLATEKANQSFSILKIVYMVDLPSLRECIYFVAEKKRYGKSDFSHWLLVKHDLHLDEGLNQINVIYSKAQPNELEKHIKRAIEIHGMIEETTPLEIKFLLTVIAMEGLIISQEEEKDYIRTKFAERVALLLGDSYVWLFRFLNKDLEHPNITEEEIDKCLIESRIALNNRMKNLYDKRSGLAHSRVRKKSKETITEDDFEFAETMFSALLRKLLDFCIKNADKRNSLVNYLERLKFGSRS